MRKILVVLLGALALGLGTALVVVVATDDDRAPKIDDADFVEPETNARVLLDALIERVGCRYTDAADGLLSTYAGAGGPVVAEAEYRYDSADCWETEASAPLRIHAWPKPRGVALAMLRFSREFPEDASLWLVVGDRWIVVAHSRETGLMVAEKLGAPAKAFGPEGMGPPPSYYFYTTEPPPPDALARGPLR